MKKPNFFIIGAPKCGTTSLAMWLSEHPNIYMSPRKEPHFFNHDGLRSTKTLEEYESLFVKAKSQHIAVGEASTHYLYSQVAVPQILEYNPESRFIVCIRNPIEMAPSLHAERLWQGEENIDSFEKAWSLQMERRRGKYIPATVKHDPQRLQYGWSCKLGMHLTRIFKYVHREKVLVLVLDDIRQNPRQEYKRVLSFLQVPDDGRSEFPVYNRRKKLVINKLPFIIKRMVMLKHALGLNFHTGIGGFIRSMVTIYGVHKTISEDVKKELVVYFQEDIHLLEELLGRDFSAWLR